MTVDRLDLTDRKENWVTLVVLDLQVCKDSVDFLDALVHPASLVVLVNVVPLVQMVKMENLDRKVFKVFQDPWAHKENAERRLVTNYRNYIYIYINC